ncbi:MAG: hypothetical protein H6744_01655 [Deltaproteobacteria bacterium]|nr:hypothetical protein [Deltaproteobacteria bacterium]
MTTAPPPSAAAADHARLTRLGRASLVAAALGALATAAALVVDPVAWLRGYVVSFHLLLAIALGSLLLLMVHLSVASRWGLVVRPVLMAALATLPLLALAAAPLLVTPLFRAGTLYPWSDPAIVAASELLQKKTAWLDPMGFAWRGVFYLLVWLGLTWWWRRLLARPEARSIDTLLPLSRPPAAAGLIALCLTVAAASVDWAMSLEPTWYSSMYPLIFLAGDALTAMAFTYAVALWLSGAGGAMTAALTRGRSRDLANLLLTCVIVFAYTAFFQYLIAWQGDKRHEVIWYVHRRAGGWQLLVAGLAVFQLALPLGVLLFRELKHRARPMLALCGVVLLMRGVDLYWTVMPAFHPGGFHMSWTFPASLCLLGGAWGFVFARALGSGPVASPEALEAAADEPDDPPLRATVIEEARHGLA